MIYIDNRQNKVEITEEFESFIEKIVEFTLKEEEVELPCEVSIILVDNEEIKELNREFRNIDSSTDVLSFPILDYVQGKVYKEMYKNLELDRSYFDGENLILGDMAISLEKTLEQSEEFGHSFQRETAYLVVHSMLHLLGYDHMVEEDKALMRAREEDILGKLGIKRL